MAHPATPEATTRHTRAAVLGLRLLTEEVFGMETMEGVRARTYLK
jgi:hypothetical protein